MQSFVNICVKLLKKFNMRALINYGIEMTSKISHLWIYHNKPCLPWIV